MARGPLFLRAPLTTLKGWHYSSALLILPSALATAGAFLVSCCGDFGRQRSLKVFPALAPVRAGAFFLVGRHESASAEILLSRVFCEALNSSEPQGPSASPLFRTRLGFEA